MAIKTILDSMDGVPEGLHELYTETDGRYVLNVEGIDDHPDVSNLRNAYAKVKESDKTAREALQDLKKKASTVPDDFDAELWNKAKSGELTEGSVKVREKLETKLKTERERAQQLEGIIRSLTVDRALADALDEANITNPAYRKAATAMLKDAVKLEGEKVYVDSDMGPLDTTEYVKKWAASDEGAAFVSQPKGGGSKSGDSSVKSTIKSWGDAKTPQEKVEFLKSKQQ